MKIYATLTKENESRVERYGIRVERKLFFLGQTIYINYEGLG